MVWPFVQFMQTILKEKSRSGRKKSIKTRMKDLTLESQGRATLDITFRPELSHTRKLELC